MPSIKMTEEEKAAYMMPQPMETPDYPGGMSLYIDEATLAKLGITKLPAPGSVVEIFGRAVVTMAEVETNGDPECMRLQITEMDPPKVVKDDASTLYGDE